MERYYGLVELVFSGGVVLGLAIFELIRVRRALREDSEKSKDPAAQAETRDGSRR